MSSATTDPTAIPSPSVLHGPLLAVPSLEELEQMTSIPDRRVVIKDVDWAFYEQLVDSIPEGVRIRVNYDGKDLEIMSLSPFHDGVKKRLGRFIELTAEELQVPCTGLGQTTWKRPEVARGLEADESYYFAAEKLAVVADAMKRGSKNVADYPNPDLGIEVDISPSRIDRPGIYASLAIAEVWRFDGEQVIIERLGEGGAYHRVEVSGFLPVRADEVRRWVVEEDALDGSRWARRLRAWARAELAPRLPRSTV
jgi:Uma2 family endonuclease